MLQISNLSKTYPNGVKALDQIALKIGKGMFGLLGPNGAGKSSLMRTIATLQEPDAGEVLFNGMDVLKQKEEMRSVLGYLPQEFGIYPRVSAEDMLHHLAILKGLVDRTERKAMVDSLLEITNLSQHRKKHLGGFSGGMRQRFGIAQALIGNPKILIVDEPTAGLDPLERDRFLNFLSTIGKNTTVILSTHIVSDVSQLCHDMAILHNGKVLIQSSPCEAMGRLEGKLWGLFSEEEGEQYKVVSRRLVHGRSLLKVFSETKPGLEFEAMKPDLEDVYFSFIKGYMER